MDVFVISSLKGKEFIVSTELADGTILNEVAKEGKIVSLWLTVNEDGRDAYMRSAFWIVDKRCAMARVVLPRAALSRASWTTFSDVESRADVASSKSRTLGFLKRARAIAIRSKSKRSN